MIEELVPRRIALEPRGAQSTHSTWLDAKQGASGGERARNGLLLRSDLHVLFDRYITVNTDLAGEVSRSTKAQLSNGREYSALHGKPLPINPIRQRRSAIV